MVVLYMIFIFVYQEIFQQLQAILAGNKLQSVIDSKFCQLLPEKRTLKLPKLIIIIIVCGMSSFVLVNLKPRCTEMFFFCIQVILAFSCGHYEVKLLTKLESFVCVVEPCFVDCLQSFCIDQFPVVLPS